MGMIVVAALAEIVAQMRHRSPARAASHLSRQHVAWNETARRAT